MHRRRRPQSPNRCGWAATGVWPLCSAAITLILAAGVIWLVRERTAKPNASLAIRSLAVLPLANFSGNSEQDYLSDGMTEALTAQLSTIHGLRVISRTSTMQLKGTRKSVPAIGKELNVDAVIEGSVLRSGDKVRVTVQLIRAATDEHLSAATYDRELRDILALQSDVAQGIARHVEAAVAGAQNLAVAPRTVAPEVYEAYLKGRFALIKGNRGCLDEALEFFTAAINADSIFAPAYVGVAATQEQLGTVFFGVPRGLPDLKSSKRPGKHWNWIRNLQRLASCSPMRCKEIGTGTRPRQNSGEPSN
jgi:TolB-like protein